MRGALAAAIVFVALPAQAGNLLSYGWGMADASVPMGDGHFNIWVHHKDNTFLIEPGLSTVMVGGGHFPDLTWRQVAEAFVSSVGCGISDVRPISRAGAAWEATFVCPPGVDLHALVKAQRAALKAGQRLKLDADQRVEPANDRKP